jgi:hypothetical protein
MGGKLGNDLYSSNFTKSVISYEMIFIFEPWLRFKLDPESKLYKNWNECASMSTERASFSHLVI